MWLGSFWDKLRQVPGPAVLSWGRREEVEGILCCTLRPLHFCKGPRGHENEQESSLGWGCATSSFRF